MKKANVFITYLTVAFLFSCERQDDKFSSEKKSETNVQKVVKEASPVSFFLNKSLKLKYSGINLKIKSPLLFDSMNNTIKSDGLLMPNTEYTIQIANVDSYEYFIKSGEGFKVLGSEKKDNNTIIKIITSSQINEKLFLSITPIKLKGNVRIEKARPNSFLLPN